VNRCDDSVIKVISNKPFFLRRSRGFTPMPLELQTCFRETIALGAELNNAICGAKKNRCFLSQYIGNTAKFETSNFLKESAERMIKLTRLKPEIVVCDLHPEYNSTLFARELAEKYNARLVQLQHHKAHVASVAAEHGLRDYVGIAMDGLGYGEDGNIWGGEVFDICNGNKFERLGHLEEQPQLGGDSATFYPKKMLFGILSGFMDEKELLRMEIFDEKQTNLHLNQLKQNFNIPVTTSAGRILDAVSALLGFCDYRSYDGRPAMVLEGRATLPYDFEPLIKNNVLMTTPLIEFILSNIDKDKGRLAATAQQYLAEGLFNIAKTRNKAIVLSGGVAYNRMISGFMLEREVLVNKYIPSGDGGICLGQAYLANISQN
ncbi:carbamoyltransferase HypF, partial [Candidatus Woesearchaeota archaeon]|nr:carbamoyltransferase HypF [Candidatus Woesearchaeota archaeon]